MRGAWSRLCRRDERGAAAVEFALVAPLLMMLVFGIITYGYMLSFRQALSQAAAEGARAAAVTILATDRDSKARAAINGGLGSYGVTCDGSTLKLNGVTAGTCTVTAAAPCETTSTTPTCVTVTLSYQYKDHALTPTFPGLGVVLPSTLSYSTTARVS